MDILRKLRGLESTLTRTMNEATQRMTTSSAHEPLEILHTIVETIEKRLEPAGRGKYVFPFNLVTINIVADCNETRARFEAVFESKPTLQERIVQTLESAGCAVSALIVETKYVGAPETDWKTPDFNIEFDRVNVLPQASPLANTVPHSNLNLTIVHGTAEKRAYLFTTSRVNLGRCREVRDNRNRLIRTNQVAFEEGADMPNLSVSRQHAHIDRIADPVEYRLRDDGSGHGTSIVRNGATITVPPGPRGIRLQSGDEIALGEALLRVEIAPPGQEG
jgi:FHA domain-containing protein